MASYDIPLELARTFRNGFTYDPGHSDLDNKQPINVRVTLGDWRELNRLIRETDIRRRVADYGSNGGIQCDTHSGPCACGAFH